MDKLNIRHFRQLLEEKEILRTQRISFFHQHPDEYIQLLFYRMMIKDQCYWQTRHEYLSSLEDFIEGKTNTNRFQWKLHSLKLNNQKRFFKLIYLYDRNFKPFDQIEQEKDLEKLFQNSIPFESKGFSNLIDSIVLCYYKLDKNSNFEEEFRNFVAEVLVAMGKYFTKKETIQQEMDKLDMEHFCQLKEKEKIITKSKKSFLLEDKEGYRQLLSYRTMIRDQYLFQNCVKYLSLIEDFLETRISQPEFVSSFDFLYYDQDDPTLKSMEQDLKQLEEFFIDPKSKGFSELIDQISDLCDRVNSELEWFNEEIDEDENDENDNDEINEINISDIFQKEIQEIYLVMKNFQTP